MDRLNRVFPKSIFSAGFTIIELLVVLVIIGLLLSIVPTLLSGSRASVEERTAIDGMENDLRVLRSNAILTGHETMMEINLAERFYDTGQGTLHHLPPKLAIDFLPLNSPIDKEKVGIKFFPDGSSTGGNLIISSSNWRRNIFIHMINGKISSDE